MIDNIELNKRGGLNSCELRAPMGYQRLYTWLTIEISILLSSHLNILSLTDLNQVHKKLMDIRIDNAANLF